MIQPVGIAEAVELDAWLMTSFSSSVVLSWVANRLVAPVSPLVPTLRMQTLSTQPHLGREGAE